jgi:hypothetical protein
MLGTIFMGVGIALGQGLLIGLQKERAESPLAGLHQRFSAACLSARLRS